MKTITFQWETSIDVVDDELAPARAAKELEEWMDETKLTPEQLVKVETNLALDGDRIAYTILVLYMPAQSEKEAMTDSYPQFHAFTTSLQDEY